MSMTQKYSIDSYSPHYREECFFKWYSEGRTAIKNLVSHLEPDERGHVPGYSTLRSWRTEYDWEERADELDKKASLDIQKKLIDDRRRMLEEHIDVGKSMREKALNYLETHEIETGHQAIRLLELAIRVEKESVGLPDVLEELGKLEDTELTERIAKILEGSEVSIDELKELPDNVSE